jgi:hypothetical protein
MGDTSRAPNAPAKMPMNMRSTTEAASYWSSNNVKHHPTIAAAIESTMKQTTPTRQAN